MFSRVNPVTVLVRALVLFTAMPIHECAHGWVADKLGDHTARSQGRLTLNPFHHLDPFGSVLLLLAGVGWAKPVPVNPYYFHKIDRRAGMALTALAGPVSNLLMSIITLLIAKLLLLFGVNGILVSIFITMCQINLGLAVFILSYFLPAKAADWLDEHEQIIYIIFMVVILFTDLLDVPLSFLSGLLFRAINWLTSFVGF